MFQLFFANVAYADELDKFLGKVTDAILDPAIKLLFALAFIMFFWGVVEFLMKANSEGNQEDGKRHMLWGIYVYNSMALFLSSSVSSLSLLIH